MDDEEFKQYIGNSILPLYPNTRDKPGHRLLLKCDSSGPGWLQVELLAQLRFLGVYLYPCVPNTTAVTQETDWTYGMFKSQYRANLVLLDKLVRQDKTVFVPQHKHGLLVFGKVDLDTGLELPSAFELGFSRQHCLESWAKIGAAPLTRKCLDEPQALGMENDMIDGESGAL